MAGRSEHRLQFARRFGANLVKARRQADLSQEELSFRASMHRTTVGQIERGVLLPGLDSVVKLAAVLEMAVGELLEDINWQAPEYPVGRFVLSEPDAGDVSGGSDSGAAGAARTKSQPSHQQSTRAKDQ
jgi:transcriptional regulator with XRE-family HTH domain